MTDLVIGLSAVVFQVQQGELFVLSIPSDGKSQDGLPFGPFAPEAHRTFELALRAFVTAQTRYSLGYVEQLYTFGDQGRDAPLADVGQALTERVVSVGYLALAPAQEDKSPADSQTWSSLLHFFPWEDWRSGRPALISEVILPHLMSFIENALHESEHLARRARVRRLFAADGFDWNEERVLERYELLYEAGLVPETARDRRLIKDKDTTPPPALGLGTPMRSDHRRILATALGRLRAKLKYRPVIFELMPSTFTLSDLQKTAEAISGLRLHKQNFRRAVERTGLVEAIGTQKEDTGGRPAALFRVASDPDKGMWSLGIPLPSLK